MVSYCEECKAPYANSYDTYFGLCGPCHKKIKGFLYWVDWNISQVTIKTCTHTRCWDNHCWWYSNYVKTYTPDTLANIAFHHIELNNSHLRTKEEQHIYEHFKKKYKEHRVFEYRNRECTKRKRKDSNETLSTTTKKTA